MRLPLAGTPKVSTEALRLLMRDEDRRFVLNGADLHWMCTAERWFGLVQGAGFGFAAYALGRAFGFLP